MKLRAAVRTTALTSSIAAALMTGACALLVPDGDPRSFNADGSVGGAGSDGGSGDGSGSTNTDDGFSLDAYPFDVFSFDGLFPDGWPWNGGGGGGADAEVSVGLPGCADGGSNPTTCGASSVDLCTSRDHCGACNAACSSTLGTLECVRGQCFDYQVPSWDLGMPDLRPLDGGSLVDAGVIVDRHTGLLWRQAQTPDGQREFDNGRDFCSSLPRMPNAYSWHVATRAETFSIVRPDETPPAVSAAAFSPTTSDWYWMASASPNQTQTILLYTGQTEVNATSAYARCVARTHVAGRPEFAPNIANNTVYDPLTRLLWDSADAFARSQPDSRTFCGIKGVGWRVPTIDELESLVDARRTSAPFMDPVFPFANGTFWSSTAERNATYWSIDFMTTKVFPLGFADTARVRCVKSSP